MGPVKPFPAGLAEIDGSETMVTNIPSATGQTGVAAGSRSAPSGEGIATPKSTQAQSGSRARRDRIGSQKRAAPLSGNPASDDGFDNRKRVLDRTSYSSATLYREIAAGRFPKPYYLSPGRVGWLRSEIAAWIAARTGGER
jgi:predicted DNA-binding transcriptional regulator AlpA